MVTVDQVLYTTVNQQGSDLDLKVDSPPMLRIHGDLIHLDMEPLTNEQTKWLAFSVLTDTQRARFEEDLELDFAYSIPGLARFRGNIYQQRGAVQSAFRVIRLHIQTID